MSTDWVRDEETSRAAELQRKDSCGELDALLRFTHKTEMKKQVGEAQKCRKTKNAQLWCC